MKCRRRLAVIIRITLSIAFLATAIASGILTEAFSGRHSEPVANAAVEVSFSSQEDLRCKDSCKDSSDSNLVLNAAIADTLYTADPGVPNEGFIGYWVVHARSSAQYCIQSSRCNLTSIWHTKVAKTLLVPYIHQTFDTPDEFVGSSACAPTSAVMVLAYYQKIVPNPITVSRPSPHTSDYGAYISREYVYNRYTFSNEHIEPNVCEAASAIGKGAWGYIWKDGITQVKNNLISYLGIHGIEAFFIEQPTEVQVKNIVRQEIDAGRPLIARTYLTDRGHYVVIVGYEVDAQGRFWYKVNDPFGDKPYGDECWGDYGTRQPVTYSFSQMQLDAPSRGLITTQLKKNQKPALPVTRPILLQKSLNLWLIVTFVTTVMVASSVIYLAVIRRR